GRARGAPSAQTNEQASRLVEGAHRCDHPRVPNEYVFVDEWDVDAPQEAVYDAIADARTYPKWWVPVYKSVEGDENVTHHRFKGKLPYTLKMRAEMIRT